MKRNTIVTVSTELPRKCGLATFNDNFVNGILDSGELGVHKRYSIVKQPQKYDIEKEKYIQEIFQNNPGSWEHCLDNIVNSSKRYKEEGMSMAAVIQFEYGIYKDNEGRDHSVDLVKGLKENGVENILIPHTVLKNPKKYGEEYKPIMEELVKNTSQIISLTHSATDILEKVYEAPREIIKHIEHGVSENKIKKSREGLKKEFGLENRILSSTGGLFSDGKDYKTVLKALRGKNIFYLIVGATHPDIKKKDGEKYREEMINFSKNLGYKTLDIRNAGGLNDLKGYDLKDYNVAFLDSFLSENEVQKIKKTSDICLIPNKGKSQISSGEISQAISAWSFVIATKSPYSLDMEKESSVFTVEHGSEESWSNCLDFILSISENEKKMKNLAKSNATKGATNLWKIKSLEISGMINSMLDFEKYY